ncbi:MAG: hypothetical protein A2Y12_19130 [Planctomycetes bacterium GWF2_42_9]|nr:MAG: hypothetical protein A2Y12_19130 [Planctomycetes bacterium GWF2_42_9]
MNTPLSEGFDVSNLSAALLQVVQQEQAEKLEQANKAPVMVRDISNVDGGVIAKFNAKYTTEEALRLSGKYTRQSSGIYLFNGSTSGVAGGHVTENGKFYTFHESDRLLCDGHSHDAFDIFVAHWFNGDFSKAVAQAATDIDPEGQKQRQFDHVKAKGILTPAPNPGTAPQANLVSLFESASDFLTETVKVEYLVRNLIEVHSLVSITGPSGQYKSFVAVDFGCCFVSGRSWNGRTVKRGAILYLAGEGRGGIKRRIKAWCIANNLALSDMRGFYLSRNTLMMDGSNIEQIVSEMAGVEVVAIFIDTTARHIPGNENDSRDMGAYINAVDALRSRLGAVAIMVHHTGHDTTRGRGSTVYRAALDTEIMCDKSQLIFSKTKDAEPPPPMEFKLVSVEIGADEDGEVITSCVPVYGERSERSKSTNFTRHEAIGIRALCEVAAKENKIINNKYAGSTEVWREHFYTLRKSEESDVKQEALKKAFQNVVKGLIIKDALVQVSTDSIVVSEEHQERISTIINLGNISITLQRETGNDGKFPSLFPAV